jgi:hypothetical protein
MGMSLLILWVVRKMVGMNLHKGFEVAPVFYSNSQKVELAIANYLLND